MECLPKDLPDRIDVDVSALEVGQAIHVSEVKLPAGVSVLNAKELPVFMVLMPTVEEEPAPGTAAAATEPEVIRCNGLSRAFPDFGAARPKPWCCHRMASPLKDCTPESNN
ncbi:MAG: hypothetical protein EBW73_04955 [Betaproteobacteria bacterium]|nr:hypothetical protein [Betaproteobacteria bacterium]